VAPQSARDRERMSSIAAAGGQLATAMSMGNPYTQIPSATAPALQVSIARKCRNPGCGRETPVGAAFCGACGTPLQ